MSAMLSHLGIGSAVLLGALVLTMAIDVWTRWRVVRRSEDDTHDDGDES
jgi:hypothetical protein